MTTNSPKINSDKILTENDNSKISNIILATKPKKFLYPNYIAPYEIFFNLKNKIIVNKKVDIKNFAIEQRKENLKKIKNFFNKFNLNKKTFYYMVYLLDKLLSNKIKYDIESICLGSLILAVKFNEIDGYIPNLKNFFRIFSNENKLKNNFNKIELNCLKNLSYNLTFCTPIYFLEIILINGIVFNNENHERINSKIYDIPFKIYEIIILKSPEYFKYNPFHIACGLVALSRKIYGLEKWNNILEKIFKINFEQFKEVYYFISNSYSEKKKEILEKTRDDSKIIFNENSILKNDHDNINKSTAFILYENINRKNDAIKNNKFYNKKYNINDNINSYKNFNLKLNNKSMNFNNYHTNTYNNEIKKNNFVSLSEKKNNNYYKFFYTYNNNFNNLNNNIIFNKNQPLTHKNYNAINNNTNNYSNNYIAYNTYKFNNNNLLFNSYDSINKKNFNNFELKNHLNLNQFNINNVINNYSVTDRFDYKIKDIKKDYFNIN